MKKTMTIIAMVLMVLVMANGLSFAKDKDKDKNNSPWVSVEWAEHQLSEAQVVPDATAGKDDAGTTSVTTMSLMAAYSYTTPSYYSSYGSYSYFGGSVYTTNGVHIIGGGW